MTSSKGAPPSIGLIGVSGYATVYTDWLIEAHRNERLKIASLAVLPSERNLPVVRTLRDCGAEIYDSYSELFSSSAPKLELCYIPTGIQWHARMTIAALRSGCNVLVEKPLAGSVKDVERVQQVETETGRWVAVGFQDMYTREIAWLKRSLIEGRIGKVRSVSMMGAWPRPVEYYHRNHWAGKLWADEAQVLDSPLNNAFAHFVNLSLYLAGETLHCSADAQVVTADLYRAHSIENFDTAVVRGKSKSGVDLWFGVSHACRETHEPHIKILGDDGYAEWKHQSECSVHPNHGPADSRQVPEYDSTRNEMFDAVLRKLKDPSVKICDTSIALKHTAFIEKVDQASDVRSVNASAIDQVRLNGNESYVPAIRNIEELMTQAFEARASLRGISCQPASV